MGEMRTITVELPADLLASFEADVAKGRTPSVDAAIQAGLEELRARELIQALGGAERLEAEIQAGVDSGEGLDADEVFAELEADLRAGRL